MEKGRKNSFRSNGFIRVFNINFSDQNYFEKNLNLCN
jgi:hypothetical protein